MRYFVVREYTLNNLESSVNENIKKGWELQGGMQAVKTGRGEVQFMQAMTTNNMSKDNQE